MAEPVASVAKRLLLRDRLPPLIFNSSHAIRPSGSMKPRSATPGLTPSAFISLPQRQRAFGLGIAELQTRRVRMRLDRSIMQSSTCNWCSLILCLYSATVMVSVQLSCPAHPRRVVSLLAMRPAIRPALDRRRAAVELGHSAMIVADGHLQSSYPVW